LENRGRIQELCNIWLSRFRTLGNGMEIMGLELGNEDLSLEMLGLELEWLSGICIAYITLRVGSLCTL
jgi:hypothetical protein